MSLAEAERERLLARAAGGAVDDAEPARREPDQTERHLRLVDREVWRKRNRRHAAISAAIAGIAVVCLALVALHVLIAENQFRLDHLQQQASNKRVTKSCGSRWRSWKPPHASFPPRKASWACVSRAR